MKQREKKCWTFVLHYKGVEEVGKFKSDKAKNMKRTFKLSRRGNENSRLDESLRHLFTYHKLNVEEEVK